MTILQMQHVNKFVLYNIYTYTTYNDNKNGNKTTTTVSLDRKYNIFKVCGDRNHIIPFFFVPHSPGSGDSTDRKKKIITKKGNRFIFLFFPFFPLFFLFFFFIYLFFVNAVMPLNSPPNSDKQQHQQRMMIERCSTLKKACEQCRRRRRVCNSQRPCAHCIEQNQDCVYSVVSDHSRSVFSTQAARRLSSGSACETCRRRKTKCDGGNPCNFCATNNIECVNHSERRHLKNNNTNTKPPVEAMDRIEDRLRRIERLMTAFTPSPLSSAAGSSGSANDSHKVRPHRHSVQGINVAKEQADLKRRGKIIVRILLISLFLVYPLHSFFI